MSRPGTDPSGPTVAFTPVPGVPEPDRVASPDVQVSDGSVRVALLDGHGRPLTLRFRPYQAVRLTTVDCYRRPEGMPHRPERVYWAAASPWMDDLRQRLAELDPHADFMERAVHFLVPAGDDVLEVVAWRVHVEHDGRTRVAPSEG